MKRNATRFGALQVSFDTRGCYQLARADPGGSIDVGAPDPDTAPMAMTGRCLCGAVTFSADDVETHFHACHCGMCRRWSGGAPFFAARVGRVTFTGGEVGRYASSEWASRGFCKACGTTLFYFLEPAQAYMMSVGAFDEQQPFALHREIFIDKKPSGYALAGDHERWTEAETFARLAPS